MRIVHSIGDNKISKETGSDENVGVLLANGLGGYAAFAKSNASRYNGWFVSYGHKIYKIIDDIAIEDAGNITEIRNNFYWTEKIFDSNIVESVFFPYQYNSLVYELNKKVSCEITLDIRESYDGRNFGRNYEIFEDNGLAFVKYLKTKNWMEDKSEGKEYEIFVAIKTDGGKVEKIGQWTTKYYEYDKSRSSFPYDRYVYKAVKIRAQKIVFSAALDKETARVEAEFVFNNAEELKDNDSQRLKIIGKSAKIPDPEINFSYIAAKNSLAGLMIEDGKKFGIQAGLPWFYQFWTSDESISLKSAADINVEFAKKVLLRDLDYINDDGRIYDIGYAKIHNQYTLNIDAPGWLFKRAAELIKAGHIDKKKIKDRLVTVIENLRKNHMKNGFIICEVGETWMDTFYAGDVRDGARIEIQASMLAMYNLAADITGDAQYKAWEAELREAVRKNFWNGKILADGLNDFRIRPNVFLAYYLYPNLLAEAEWITCIKEILPALWLDWGGFATIDKSSPIFFNKHSGQDPESYHRGDSWFWINNLAVIALYRLNSGLFKDYIGKILEQSLEQILWHGYLGHLAEVSSAGQPKSEGAWNQAWSAAMYLEAIDEIIKA